MRLRAAPCDKVNIIFSSSEALLRGGLARSSSLNQVMKLEHNSSFMTWFRDELRANPPRSNASEEEKMIFTLSQGAARNLMTYQAYDINDYTFYTEEKDNNCDYQNSGVTGIFYTDDVKERF